jgi:hypothetical protein
MDSIRFSILLLLSLVSNLVPDLGEEEDRVLVEEEQHQAGIRLE